MQRVTTAPIALKTFASEQLRSRRWLAAIAALFGLFVIGVVYFASSNETPDPTATATITARAPEETPSFYLEAWQERSNAGINQPRETYGLTRSQLRWWAADAHRWRYEEAIDERTGERSKTVSVSDGASIWSYLIGAEMYQRQDAESDSGYANSIIATRSRLGPVPEKDLDALVAYFQRLYETPHEVRILAEEQFLGRRVIALEYEPALQYVDGVNGTVSAGVGRLLVDAETLFILKHAAEIPGWGELFHAEVATIRYGDQIKPELLAFKAPAGTSEMPRPLPNMRPDPPL